MHKRDDIRMPKRIIEIAQLVASKVSWKEIQTQFKEKYNIEADVGIYKKVYDDYKLRRNDLMEKADNKLAEGFKKEILDTTNQLKEANRILWDLINEIKDTPQVNPVQIAQALDNLKNSIGDALNIEEVKDKIQKIAEQIYLMKVKDKRLLLEALDRVNSQLYVQNKYLERIHSTKGPQTVNILQINQQIFKTIETLEKQGYITINRKLPIDIKKKEKKLDEETEEYKEEITEELLAQ